jgi:hypothetical protein
MPQGGTLSECRRHGHSFLILDERHTMKRKISELLLEVSREYIALGEDDEHKRHLLNGAVSAWNIACLPVSERTRALQTFMTAYKNMNPTQTQEDYADVEWDMNKLIENKCLLFPDVKSQIVNATLSQVEGKLHVTVVSARA